MEHKPCNPEALLEGIKTGRSVIGYSTVIRTMDNGGYDRDTVKGLRILACIWEATAKGWYSLSISNEVIIWRWLVVTVFLIELLEKNGFVKVPNASGSFDEVVIYHGKNGSMGIDPWPERFCLANHVESFCIEKYGSTKGLERAIQIYKSMLMTNPGPFTLSDWGRDSFEILHDDIIKQLKTKGMPDMPVIH